MNETFLTVADQSAELLEQLAAALENVLLHNGRMTDADKRSRWQLVADAQTTANAYTEQRAKL